MPRFGLKSHKKSRTARAGTIGASSTLSGRLDSVLHNRDLLLRLSLCALALLAIPVAVQGWKKPFTYRLGDHPAHGVLATVDFEQRNDFETRRARSRAGESVPYYFRHDPGPLTKLPVQLRADLKAVAGAAALDDLPPGTQVAFGLLPTDDLQQPGLTSEEIERVFRSLKLAVTGQDAVSGEPTSLPERQPAITGEPDETGKAPGAAEDPAEVIVHDFVSLMTPMLRLGIVDPNDLTRNRIQPGRKIAILQVDGVKSEEVVQSEVLLNGMLKDSGLLGKSWGLYPRLVPIRHSLERWLLTRVPTTLRYDSAVTKRERLAASERVPDVNDHYNPNDVLVDPGDTVDEERLAILRAEYDAMEKTVLPSQRVVRVAIVFLMLLVLAVLMGYYLVHNEPHLVRNAGRLSIYLLAIVATIALGRVLSFDPWCGEVIPLTVTVMIVAIAYNQVLATLTAFALSLILTFSTVADLTQFVVLMSVSATAVIPLASVPSRSRLILVGFWTGAAFFIVSWGIAVIETQSMSVLWTDTTLLVNSLRGAGWCLAAGYLVAGSLPFVESLFGVVTDISLLEMSDISHPVLQELVRRAPGTYNHSIAVATIAEAAADSIGANGLLVRVGAYFHDIGKMLKPHYFIENLVQGSESRHDHLAPAMSTLIIIGHVKDGVDLAKQHNLPQGLIDFIEQHHGTTLVQYFFHAASKQAGENPDHRTDAEESSFRYPGPKPQTREAGVFHLADTVEGASRTLSDPTPKRIENLVHKITMARLMDGQFDECNLTLSQLRAVEESLTKSLIGIYHGRIKYPDQQSA